MHHPTTFARRLGSWMGLLVITMLVGACGASPETPTPQAAAPTVAPPTATGSPPTATVAPPTLAPPTATVAPTTEQGSERALLPAPLYFLNKGQVWRLEQDGKTLHQLTSDPLEISDFDISRDD